MRLDKDTREAILQAVRQAQMEVAEMYDERWVTATELCATVTMFTKDWLDDFGWKLPRERIEVMDEEGKKRVTRWGYPLHCIQRMLREGAFRV